MSEAMRSFRFSPEQTPLGRFQDAAAACLIYFFAVRLAKAIMARRKAFDLRPVIVVHNIFLTTSSTILFSLFGILLAEKAHSFSAFGMVCSMELHQDGRLQTLYYLNYLLKWYELLDTFFLIFRKREVIFLHEYHHAATLFLCWIQMEQHSTVQWVPITINLLVHMFMYYYYTLAALKITVWWKKYLTQLQILQFIIGIAACVYASSHEPVLAGFGASGLYKRIFGAEAVYCHGTLAGATTGVGILFSYLVLFFVFYFNTYRSSKSQAKGTKRE